MLKIRLQRVGKKHEPVFRLVICDSKRGPKTGSVLEVLGSYDAREKNETKIDEERVKHWISQGAQVSDTVHNLLIGKGIIKGEKINVLPKKSPVVKEEESKEEKPAENPTSPEASQDEPKDSEAPAQNQSSDEHDSGQAEEPKEEEKPAEEAPAEEPKEEEKKES
jgi:small subunit ribosomal protein S16